MKTRRNFSTQIGVGGVANDSVATIPLASTTDLPTDTAITATINRVDGDGVEQANTETVVGVVSGTDLVTCVRGVEGTAQAWDAGTVVECLWTETNVNRMVDGILVAHNQNGTLKTNVALTTNAATLTTPTITTPTIRNWDGWVEANETWTYASATTLTVSGDVTGKYQKGDKVKLTNSTVKYFYITNVSYSAPNTTITVNGGTDYTLANAAISANYYSKVASPQGFPQWFNYTPTCTGWAATPTTNCVFNVIGDQVFYQFEAVGTSNAVTAYLTLPVTAVRVGSGGASAYEGMLGLIQDNGSYLSTPGRVYIDNNSLTQLNCNKDAASGSWTASGSKTVRGAVFYRF